MAEFGLWTKRAFEGALAKEIGCSRRAISIQSIPQDFAADR